MKSDLATKVLMLFVGGGLWAVTLTHGLPVATAKTTAAPPVQNVVGTRWLVLQPQIISM